MQFTQKLREGVRRGDITTSIRVWQSPRVKVDGRYPVEGGHVIVTSIREIEWRDVSDSLARESGFRSLADLMQTAQHGKGRHLYFIRFRFEGSDHAL
ncbi:MAG TPA: ASCH domain-containing protein [Roseateles sp.]|uniref:ASCH domain-containing protein n=1 Tax=Roseateles sp. TaxID=1971397 RepID=UPI002EDBA369